MKKFILALMFSVITLSSATSWAYLVPVNGYIRSNGTVVGPYMRTSPDSNPYNNLGSSLNGDRQDMMQSPYMPNMAVAVNEA